MLHFERQKLFGNPSRVQGRLSPDGKWFSWIAPRVGALNIWVAPVSDPFPHGAEFTPGLNEAIANK